MNNNILKMSNFTRRVWFVGRKETLKNPSKLRIGITQTRKQNFLKNILQNYITYILFK